MVNFEPSLKTTREENENHEIQHSKPSPRDSESVFSSALLPWPVCMSKYLTVHSFNLRHLGLGSTWGSEKTEMKKILGLRVLSIVQ